MTTTKVNNGISIDGTTSGRTIAPFQLKGHENIINIGSSFETYTDKSENPAHQKMPKVRFESKTISDPASWFVNGESLKELHKTIFISINFKKKCIIDLTWPIIGMAGSGKTETVRKYVQNYKDKYGHCLWVDASTTERADKSFEEVKKCISENSENLSVDNVYDFLCQEHCLIVFDDADGGENLFKTDFGKKFFPKTIKTDWKNPVIIVTSRNRNWGIGNKNAVVLARFSDTRCWNLLKNLLQLKTEINLPAVKRINELCDGLPFAIQQVAVIIRDQVANRKLMGEVKLPDIFQHFLEEFLDRGKNYVDFKPKHFEEPYSSNVFELFSMSYDKILNQSNGALAIKCLNIMSMLHHKCIPTKLIYFMLKPEPLLLVSRALNLLDRYNLITVCNTYCEIHPIIQLVKFTAILTKKVSDQPTLAEAFTSKVSKYFENQTQLPASASKQLIGMGLEFAENIFEETNSPVKTMFYLKSLAEKLKLYQELTHSHMILITGSQASGKQQDLHTFFQDAFQEIAGSETVLSNNNRENSDEDARLQVEVQKFLKEKLSFVVYDSKFKHIKDWIKKNPKIGPVFIAKTSNQVKHSFVSVVENPKEKSAGQDYSTANIELCVGLALFVQQVVAIIEDQSDICSPKVKKSKNGLPNILKAINNFF